MNDAPVQQRCTFPGCTGTFDPELARVDPYTGWTYLSIEGDVPVHDCRVAEEAPVDH